MPIYEYACCKCEKSFEVLVRTGRDIPAKCKFCGAPKPRKQFSSFAVSNAQPNFPSQCTSCSAAGTGCGGVCNID